MSRLTEDQLLLVEYLIKYEGNISETASAMGKTYRQVYDAARSKSIKEEILERQRDSLALATISAVNTMKDMVSADNTVEQGALRLKAAESVLNRTGLTSHTSVEVKTEAQPGIFVLPEKAKITVEPSDVSSEDDDT